MRIGVRPNNNDHEAGATVLLRDRHAEQTSFTGGSQHRFVVLALLRSSSVVGGNRRDDELLDAPAEDLMLGAENGALHPSSEGSAKPYRIATRPCEHGGMAHLILASSSPRRQLLLRAAGFEFDVQTPDVDERLIEGEDPDRMVVRLAREKAIACSTADGAFVLGADTTVVLDGRILGKPKGEAEAVEMLMSIGGRTHLVITGWALAQNGGIVEDGFEVTLVSMRSVDRGDAETYAASGEPLDKAGAYALQGDGAQFVSGIAGSRSNVVGLPLKPVVQALSRAGVDPALSQP